MSKAWAKGSTTKWRKLRLFVLNRDGWVCQLCKQPIDPGLHPPDPMSASVHHAKGKVYGDDPAHLVAAHSGCNAKTGDPNRGDPAPVSATRWR